jgi:inorganic pyrophosphatase
MNLWYEVPRGDKIPEEFNCIIEIPKFSYNKYEIDKETGLIGLDRVNFNAAPYPFDYGFVPQTLWEDGDALDVVVLTTFPLYPGILVKVRPVAMMEMTDSGDSDNKILCVPVDDKRWDDVQDLEDINKHSLKEFKLYFETCKILKSDDPEKYKVVVHGYKGKKEALQAIEKSVQLYNDKFAK